MTGPRPVRRAQHPLVSVVIPSLNRASLKTAVASVFAQDYAGEIEIVIVFDGPPSEATVLPPAPVNRLVRAITLGRNWRTFLKTGVCEAPMAVGYYAAAGEYITALSDDDEFPPNFVRGYLEVMQRAALDVLVGPTASTYGGKTRLHVPVLEQDERGQVHRLECTCHMVRAEMLRFANWDPGYGIGAEVDVVARWLTWGARGAAGPELPVYQYKQIGSSSPLEQAKLLPPAAARKLLSWAQRFRREELEASSPT